MTGWAGATAQQASADETGAALGGAPRPNCEKSVGQQLLQRANAQATLGRSPPSRLAQTTRIAVYRRITTYRTRSLAANNPATRHLICRGAVCTFPEFKAAGLKMRLSLSPGPPSHARKPVVALIFPISAREDAGHLDRLQVLGERHRSGAPW